MSAAAWARPFGGTDGAPSFFAQVNTYIDNCRVVVENAFGRLKMRFRSLKFLDCATSQAPFWILACCVLHNFIERREGKFEFYGRRDGDPPADPERLIRDEIYDDSDVSSGGVELLRQMTAYIHALRKARDDGRVARAR